MLQTGILRCREPGQVENIPYPDRAMTSYLDLLEVFCMLLPDRLSIVHFQQQDNRIGSNVLKPQKTANN